jgi:methyl-accepting chemotaxis protein-like sensor
MAAGRDFREDDAGPGQSSLPPAVLVTFAAAVCAGIAGSLASGVMAWISVGAVALGGAYFASRTAAPRKMAAELGRARRLLLLVERGGSPEAKVPPDFPEDWAQVYEKVNRLALDARGNPSPGGPADQLKKQVELAASLVRDGKDPLVEAPQLRASPLLPLLEGVKGSGSLPVVSQMSLGEEEELIGAGGDALPPDWPKSSAEPTAPPLPPAAASVVGTEVEKGLRDLIREIESLRTTLAGSTNDAAPSGGDDQTLRTPAQLVDAVVLTAADGIEDLAAGLMRANELASVAERVTNRATLLALNAALEATRSGSEAFAAIAEETRRLAEFAREATDTISRLSSEIEYKVGETITAIHATSNDAKTALAEMSGSAASVPSSNRNARVQVVRLLDRSRELLKSLGSSEPMVGGSEPGPGDPIATRSSKKPRNSAQDNVENAPEPAEKSPVEGVLLIEGLKPGAHFES